ncbi:glutamate synthase subunit beta [Lentisphaerota bacterium WC36G]|nr:glutamate synthase subunit beta [Lentisphaerae bacterium WC36]
MSNPRGFLEIDRVDPGYRNKDERVKDYKEVEKFLSEDEIKSQSSRCMDCGIPFCHGLGCPLSNVIPEWNELASQGKYQEALELLLDTSNFPEFTGRICPALCEASCTSGIDGEAVTIRQIEKFLVEKGFEEGWIKPQPPKERSDKKIAVIGAGPAGMAVADDLNKMGHNVTVFERANYAGGLLRYGIPDFKLDKNIVQRRVDLMTEEGVTFKFGVNVGVDTKIADILADFDAVCLTYGARAPRGLPENVVGRNAKGVEYAMDFLTQQNCRVSGEKVAGDELLAIDKNIVVIGGGDTGSDCVGTSNRQGAKSVTQIEIMPCPPETRDASTPWPEWPYMLRTSSSHKEGCERMWDVLTKEVVTNDEGHVTALNCAKVEWKIENGRPVSFTEVEGSEFQLKADLVLLAMGFVGPEKVGSIDDLGLNLDPRGNIVVNENGMTSAEKVFAAGDIVSGASLVVRAIKAGKDMAIDVDNYLK